MITVALTNKNLPYPLANASQGIGSCVAFELLPDGIFDTALTTAFLELTVDKGAVTGSFDLDGITFTIDGATDFTNITFKVDASSALNTANNLRNMLLSNLDIFAHWYVEIEYINADEYKVNITSKVWNYKPTSVYSQSFSNAFIAGVYTNYSDSVVMEGLKIVWVLYQKGITETGEAMPLNGIIPLIDYKTGLIQPIKLNFNDIVSRSLSTTFPSKEISLIKYDKTIINRYFLRYGWINKTGCTTLESQTEQSEDVIVINNSITKNSYIGMYDYCWLDGLLRKAKFLNSNYIGSPNLPSTAMAWLWHYDNIVTQVAPDRQFVLYSFLDSIGLTLSSEEIDFNTGGIESGYSDSIGVVRIPCGWGNLPVTSYPSGYERIQIAVFYQKGGSKVRVSERVSFGYKSACSLYEFYFLSPKGGFDTIHFETIEEVTFDVSQNFVNANSYCRDYGLMDETGMTPSPEGILDYLTFLNTTGRKQTGTQIKREFKISSKKVRPDEDFASYFEDFLASESRKMRLTSPTFFSETGMLYTENIIITHSSIITFADEGMIQYQFRFQFANQNIPISEY